MMKLPFLVGTVAVIGAVALIPRGVANDTAGAHRPVATFTAPPGGAVTAVHPEPTRDSERGNGEDDVDVGELGQRSTWPHNAGQGACGPLGMVDTTATWFETQTDATVNYQRFSEVAAAPALAEALARIEALGTVDGVAFSQRFTAMKTRVNAAMDALRGAGVDNNALVDLRKRWETFAATTPDPDAIMELDLGPELEAWVRAAADTFRDDTLPAAVAAFADSRAALDELFAAPLYRQVCVANTDD